MLSTGYRRAAGVAGLADRVRAIRPDKAGEACPWYLSKKASPEGGFFEVATYYLRPDT